MSPERRSEAHYSPYPYGPAVATVFEPEAILFELTYNTADQTLALGGVEER